jgi:multimeric flavodoxin WrbA
MTLPDVDHDGAIEVLALNCTLKREGTSSTDRMLDLVAAAFAEHGGTTSSIRIAERDVRFGVTSDEGHGDEWPDVLRQILACDVLVIGTPIWLGHPSSVCQMVLERLDALIGETGDDGRSIVADKLAAVAVVGNEDGAHAVTADVLQGLNDVGFTIAAGGSCYWVGEAMGSVDFKDLPTVPDTVAASVADLAHATVHLVRALRRSPTPVAA